MSLAQISDRIKAAESQPGQVKLIAVSKVQPDDRVRAVLENGHRVFGENRVQEASGKWPSFKEEFKHVELHLLGPLQSNKVRTAMELFDVIHTLDRLKLARKIAALRREFDRCPDLYVQVNTGQEDQKAGIPPNETEVFVAECRALDLPVIGLMCIPPADEDPVPHFKMLRDLAASVGLDGLSMGMSADFEAAIAQGATCVRVGSAIFGARLNPG